MNIYFKDLKPFYNIIDLRDETEYKIGECEIVDASGETSMIVMEDKKSFTIMAKDKGIRIDRFELCICTGEFQYGESNGASFSYGELKETSRRINLIKLIEYIVMGAEKFLEQYNNDNNKYGTIQIIKF